VDVHDGAVDLSSEMPRESVALFQLRW